jgi:hypothetical protein
MHAVCKVTFNNMAHFVVAVAFRATCNYEMCNSRCLTLGVFLCISYCLNRSVAFSGFLYL